VYAFDMPAPALARLAKIDCDLDSAPPAIRFRPLVRATWRALLLTPAELASLVARPEGLATFDRLAVTIVGRAVLGDLKAAGILADMIEGKPDLRRGDARPSGRRRPEGPAA
jgi:hypothetical protein